MFEMIQLAVGSRQSAFGRNQIEIISPGTSTSLLKMKVKSKNRKSKNREFLNSFYNEKMSVYYCVLTGYGIK